MIFSKIAFPVPCSCWLRWQRAGKVVDYGYMCWKSQWLCGHDVGVFVVLLITHSKSWPIYRSRTGNWHGRTEAETGYSWCGPPHTALGWCSRNWTHCCRSGILLWVKFPKIGEFRHARAAKFSFPNTFLLHTPKWEFEVNICLTFNCIPPKRFWQGQRKNHFFSF